MKPFLYYVAQDLIARYGNNLSEVTIVFPGKRASLYMNNFLSYFAQGPVWAPRFTTIAELFQQLSTLSESESIPNICKLYNIYSQLVSNPESLDDFYGWGEILLNDFDDIDKHMVDADRLFSNAADLAELDEMDYLDDTQIQVLRDFFANFDPEHQTEIKRKFMEMWKVMPQMYHRLKEELRKEGLMYRGGLYREVAENIKSGEWRVESGEKDIYAFVGFNVLDEVEETLFRSLRESEQAIFYWDYDVYYASEKSDHEAGLFLRHNLEHYPNALSKDIFDNLIDKEKRIRFLATGTDNAQVRYLPQWIAEQLTEPENESAVILCDEALMRPVLHAIPSSEESEQAPKAVNITMGYPLTDTSVYGYYCALADLQNEGYDTDLKRFRPSAIERLEKNALYPAFPKELLPLRHTENNLEFIDWLSTAIEALGKTNLDDLQAESVFQIYRILGMFRNLIVDGTLQVKSTTLRRLIRQSVTSAKVPFHGEMDEGLQIMGVLEARNLDFRHLIMLSVGEGIIPRKLSDTSLIPYILRSHFGLDTTERQDAVYAYSFYRLLQRAEDITLVYNENSSGASQREQSRFLRQLEAETDLHIERLTNFQQSAINTPQVIQVDKDDRIMEILNKKKSLSPTAINQYIDCPLKFYYQQVARIRIPERPQDGINAALFGTIFHDTCEIFYTHLQQITGRKNILHSDIEVFVAKPKSQLLPYLDLVFWVDFFHGQEYDSREHPTEREAFLTPYLSAPNPEYLRDKVAECYGQATEAHFTGVNMIIREVLLKLVTQLLRWDMEHTPFEIYGMEVDKYTKLSVPSGDSTIQLSIGGRIDRMDIMTVGGQRTLRLVDYKTGKAKSAPKDIEGIFNSTGHDAHGYYLQTFLYAIIVAEEQQLPVSPSLFYILSATDPKDYNPTLKLGNKEITDIGYYAAEYRKGLLQVLSNIYNPNLPFVQTENTGTCEYCDFRRLCNR